MALRVSSRKRKKKSLKETTEPLVEELDQYEINAIIAESKDQYEVAWKNTWVLKSWANQTAIDDWTARQLQLQAAASLTSSSLSEPPNGLLSSTAPVASSSSKVPDALLSSPAPIASSLSAAPNKLTGPGTHTAGPEVDESSLIESDSVSQDKAKLDWHLFTLIDGSQIRVNRANYIVVDSASARAAQHVIVTGNHEIEPAFQPRPRNLIISSTTEEDSQQAAQQIFTQSQHSHDQATTKSPGPPHSSSKDSSGLLSQTVFVPAEEPRTIQRSPQQPVAQDSIGSEAIIDSSLTLPVPPLYTLQDTANSLPEFSLDPHEFATLLSPQQNMSAISAVPSQVMEEVNNHPNSLTTQSEVDTSSATSDGAGAPLLEPSVVSLVSVHDGVHAVGLNMIATQREQYQSLPEPDMEGMVEQIIGLASQDIDQDLFEQGEEVLNRLRSILTHPDLDTSGAMTQYDIPAERQADWDSQCSIKFNFLREVFTLAADHGLHFVIAVDGGRELRLLRRFLEGLHIPLAEDISDAVTTSVTILEDELPETAIKPADVVISLNLDWHDNPPILVGRAHTPAPCLQLVVPHSVEHIELSLPRGLSAQSRLKVLLENVRASRSNIQASQDDPEVVQGIAQALVDHLIGDTSMPWPIAELSRVSVGIDNSLVQYAYSKGKRALEDAEGRADPKRPRLDGDDSTTISEIKSSNNDLQAKLTAAEAQREKLEKDLLYSRTRLNEFERNVEKLFDETEDFREQVYDLQRERDTANAAVTRLKDRLDAKTIAAASLREERTALREQLRSANISLTSHVVPERAELEQYRQAAQQATEKAEKAQGRLDSMNNDLTYARSEYQQARDSAYSLALENNTLIEKLEVAEKAAALELSKARQLSLDKLTELTMKDNKRLKTIVEAREAALKQREEEIGRLKDLGRGRIGTRAGSVPRSPRMGSPMKLLPDGMASRHSSPAGDPRDKARLHPLRNG